MAIKSSELSGIITGHTACIFNKKVTHPARGATWTKDACLVAILQIWLKEEQNFIHLKCPEDMIWIGLDNSREPSIEELAEVVTKATKLYPLKMHVRILKEQAIEHNGFVGQAMYKLVSMPPLNLKPLMDKFNRRPTKEPTTPVVPVEEPQAPSTEVA